MTEFINFFIHTAYLVYNILTSLLLDGQELWVWILELLTISIDFSKHFCSDRFWWGLLGKCFIIWYFIFSFGDFLGWICFINCFWVFNHVIWIWLWLYSSNIYIGDWNLWCFSLTTLFVLIMNHTNHISLTFFGCSGSQNICNNISFFLVTWKISLSWITHSLLNE